MRTITATNVASVYNNPPLVNEILDEMRPDGITPRTFARMVEDSREFDLGTILTAMTRQIDLSGLIPNLVGTCDDPQDTLEILANLGHAQLMEICHLDVGLQVEVFAALKGGRCTLRALLALDECQHAVIDCLSSYRQRSPLAQAFRQATETALRELYHHPEKMVSDIFDRVISYRDLRVLYQGVPRICYTSRLRNGILAEVWQYFFIPRLERVRLPAPYQALTTAGILERITPHIYNRRLSDDRRFDPHTPTGFIGLLGKVGGALPRLLVRQAEKNELLRKQRASEYELAENLYGLFSR